MLIQRFQLGFSYEINIKGVEGASYGRVVATRVLSLLYIYKVLSLRAEFVSVESERSAVFRQT